MKRQANLRLGRAALLSKRGEWLEAVVQVEQSIAVFEQVGDMTEQCWAFLIPVNLHNDLGKWALAAQAYSRPRASSVGWKTPMDKLRPWSISAGHFI